jgi:hypothetical protein
MGIAPPQTDLMNFYSELADRIVAIKISKEHISERFGNEARFALKAG